ncbi:MAG: metallophosphoesterase [Bacteroidia bacterium]
MIQLFSAPKPDPDNPKKGITRSQFISRTSLVVAGIPFIATIHGIVREKYNYKIHRVKVPIANLPKAFEGMTITQISDVHTGSFDSFNSVKAGIELINEQESDYIFFTGDLVNNMANEIGEYADLYKQLYARGGVFSVLGNHDYGDYVRWENPVEKEDNLKRLMESQRSFGWNLMMNENQIITKGDHLLAIIGVENYGAKARFAKYGKLDLAYQGAENADLKILLSHDPSHWDAQVRPEYGDIDLTLSGHTHGFQFGVEIPGFVKWSPSQFVYDQWAGHYQEGNQHLYVNRGFGFLGFSGRVGIRPEITVLELSRA